MSVSACRIPKYQHFKARNLAKVRIDGRDIYLGPYDSPESHAAYKRVIAEWLVGKTAPPPPEESRHSDLTVCELMLAYLKYAREYYVKDGKQTREYGLIREACIPLRQLYDMKPADEFGPLSLRAVRSEMITRGWCRSYINKQVGRLVRMFRWGVGRELVRAEAYQALRAVEGLKRGRTQAPDHAKVKPVPDNVVEATLSQLSPTVADMVRFQRLTGCRPTEVCLIRPVDVDRSGDVWVYCPESHKTQHHGKDRAVFLGPRAQKILSKYLLRPDHEYCFDPRKTRSAPSNSRCRYSKDSYGRAVRRGAERAGVEPWSPNRLRHAAATEIRREFGVEAAQVTLGHAAADVTQVYAERDYRLAADVARKLG